MKSFTLKLLMFPTQQPNHNCYFSKVQSVSFWFHKFPFGPAKMWYRMQRMGGGGGGGGYTYDLTFFSILRFFANLTFFSNLTFPSNLTFSSKLTFSSNLTSSVKVDNFLKLYGHTNLSFRFDVFIKTCWFFYQMNIVLNLIFLSTIDKNIKNHSFLFQ